MSLIQLYKKITRFHKNEKLIEFSASPIGKIIIVILAYVLLPSSSIEQGNNFFPPRNMVIFCLVFFMTAPKYRTSILSMGSFYTILSVFQNKLGIELFYSGHIYIWLSLFTAIFFYCGIFYLCYRASKIYERLPRLFRKNPQICLHTAIWLALIPGWLFLGSHPYSPPVLFIWLFLTSLPFVAWRIGYLFLSGRRGSAKKTRFQDHLFYLWPLYVRSIGVPHGKGYDYLSQSASKAKEGQAKSQLAGIRLLVLAKIWWMTQILLMALVHGEFHSGLPDILHSINLELPRVFVFVSEFTEPGFYRSYGWISLVMELVTETLKISVLSHVVIGCLRLFGFYVFRNTYKPLLSQTILEFWNRYCYYFKELLVEFFFYPTYLTCFKGRPRLRLFAATVAAAFVGNLYYHLFRFQYVKNLFSLGFKGACYYMAPQAFYCLLLTLGIYISFLREKKRQGKRWETGTWPARIKTIRRIFVVLLYFSIIRIWSINEDVYIDFLQLNNFFFWLIGL